MVIVRTLALLIAASVLSACSSFEGTASHVETLTTGVKEGGQKVASSTARGAKAVGKSVGTAYHGVTNGFQDPESKAFGPYPDDYLNTIRKHMMRFEGVKETASFYFDRPVRGYVNQGLLLGGEIDWQGWVVDVAIETKTLLGQPERDEYVVRMNGNDIVEVVEKRYAGAIARVPAENSTPSVPAAPRH
jgi:hypothetical protein